MNDDMTQLNELIEITRDGQHFYQHALEVVKDVELQHLFRDMAQSKTHIIQALSVKVAANQEQPAQGGTTAGKLREMYADTKARLGHADAVYIDQLDQTEERIIAAFEDALKTPIPTSGHYWPSSCRKSVPVMSEFTPSITAPRANEWRWD